MKEGIRILLVGDHELIRYGLRRMLEQEEDMEVVGDCTNAEEAFSEMARFHPDIVLMDIQTPGMNEIETIRSLKRDGLDYDGGIIMLAESVDYRVEALEAGAASYLLKDITHAELAQAIREVYWSKQSPDGRKDLVEEAVELVVPPAANAAVLLRFICQLGESLDDNYSNKYEYDYASITQSVGSWDKGTVITLLIRPTALVNLLERLADMTEVEKVEEEPLAKDAFFSFPKKFGVLLRPNISPSKRIRVTLKETGMAR